MTQYIDKSALVAEIKRRLLLLVPKMTFYQQRVELEKLLSFIDTLEVKEVDLEKEMSNYLGDDWRKDADGKIENEMVAFAKHFFELGLKAQKGEEV